MAIAGRIENIIANASWIRKMFEAGAHLKEEHGPENVFDFSLGNPNLEPPENFQKALSRAASDNRPGIHGYMPNTGYPDTRRAVAENLSQEQDAPVTEDNVIMTCGAAGALNVIFKTILDPDDEVITPAPYFVEYGFYADNHGGKLKTVPSHADFTLDIDGIAAAITEKTKAVLINSPNNPTGQVYSGDSLKKLGKCLKEKSEQMGRTIYLVADEPYRKLVYDGIDVPSIFSCYNESIIATSYSKDLSIPGERIGFLAVNPSASYRDDLVNGMALANRILGFVNAPGMMQRVIAETQGAGIDASIYAKKRELLCDGLAACGYEFTKPSGAFYLFPRAPIKDDIKFVQALQKELILTVPGSGFGGPGYFRIAYCVDDDTIINAIPGFKKVIEKY